MKTAILFIAHFVSGSNVAKYKKLANELGDKYDLYWVFQSDNGQDFSIFHEHNIRLFTFTLEELNELLYSPISEKLYGSEHFIMEYFFKIHPEYDFYWGIEYDVIYTGNWDKFFNSFYKNDADFLASHIEIYDKNINGNWCWWNRIFFSDEDIIPKGKLVKSFNPIYRISNRALAFLDNYLKKDGNGGFYELIMVTPLYNNGFRVEDFGGTGKFVAEGNRNRFYVQGVGVNTGTFRWTPEFTAEEIIALQTKDKLFHPLKQEFL